MGLPHRESRFVQEELNGTLLEELEHAMMQISWLGQRQFMQLLDSERFRLTLPQFYTLLYLQQMAGNCKMSDLADATYQSAASLTGVVDRLLEKQLVARTRHPRDRRQVMVVVTPLGSELIAEVKEARRAQMQAALAALPRQDVEALLGLLDQVIAGMLCVLSQNNAD